MSRTIAGPLVPGLHSYVVPQGLAYLPAHELYVISAHTATFAQPTPPTKEKPPQPADASVPQPTTSIAAVRNRTHKGGRERLRGEPVRLRDGEVTIRRKSDGREFVKPLNELADEDVKQVISQLVDAEREYERLREISWVLFLFLKSPDEPLDTRGSSVPRRLIRNHYRKNVGWMHYYPYLVNVLNDDEFGPSDKEDQYWCVRLSGKVVEVPSDTYAILRVDDGHHISLEVMPPTAGFAPGDRIENALCARTSGVYDRGVYGKLRGYEYLEPLTRDVFEYFLDGGHFNSVLRGSK